MPVKPKDFDIFLDTISNKAVSVLWNSVISYFVDQQVVVIQCLSLIGDISVVKDKCSDSCVRDV